MAHPPVPPPSPEHRRVAAGKFDRANQVVATGNYDYGIHLLRECCRLDPANLLYRQALRRTEKAKYRNNLRGSRWAWLTAWAGRARLRAALRTRDYLRALEHGEDVLARNPWDVGAQTGMAEAAEALGLLDLAAWVLEQARHKQARDPALNRALARLYEKRGNFLQAAALWELVAKADPADAEAQGKVKDLGAQDAIVRGQYQEALEDSRLRGPVSGAEGRVPEGRDPAAREAAPLRARLKDDPTNADLHLQLARVYRRANQLEEAHAVLTEGLGATGNAFELVAERADLEIEPFRRNLAVTEERLKAVPDDGPLREIRIRLRKEVNTRELELFRLKADRHPTDLAHTYQVGVRLLRAGQLDEAIRLLQGARADARLRWQSLLYLGYCFKERGNPKLAARNFAEALGHLPAAEDGHRKELLFELAQMSAAQGDLARAVEHGTELANLDFGYRDVARLLDEWQARLREAEVS